MHALIQDIRYGIRTLAKTPGFAAIAILTLALGIGANSALFSVVNGVLLNSLPYPEPDKIMMVYANTSDFGHSSVAYLNFVDWQKNSHSFAAMGAYRNENMFLTGVGEGERVRGEMISADYFRALGVEPIAGRTFRPDEDQVGAPPVALISAGLWARKFSSSPDIVGKSITLTGKSYMVAGIIPASFSLYDRPSDVYIPIGQWNDPTFRDRAVSFGTRVLGRLKPGVTMQQAQAEMDLIARNLATAYPQANKGMGIAVVSLKEDLVGDIKPFLLVLLGAVGFVLLIACANVANLLLARSTGRTREFAIRTALGAGRARVVRQLLTESVLLSIAGGGLGLIVAYLGTRTVLRTLPQALPRAREISMDWHVLLFTLGVSLAVGIIFGLAPALKMSRGGVAETLKEGGRGASAAKQRTQSIFVALEMALALVLLVGAGLMIRSLTALWNVNPGFDPHNALAFDTTLPPGLEQNPNGLRAVLRQVHGVLTAIPGVQAVSMQGGSLPMQGDSELPFWKEGQAKPATLRDMPEALFYLVEPDYLKAMGTPLVRGRFLTDQDNEHAQPVIVIDEVFARKYFPNEDAIGKRVNLAFLDTQPEIIGIAGHVKHFGLDSDATAAIQAQMYLPMMQLPDKLMPLVAKGIGFVARTAAPPGDIAPVIRATVAKFNSSEVIYGVQTLDEIVADSLAARRFSMILLGVFAGLALILSSIGIYGVISYLVGQRTHEIGIRMALGAQQRDVLGLVLGQGIRMALVGVAIGLAAAIALTRLMSKMLFAVSATDPLTMVGVSVLLIAVALAACYIPARRAMRTDPIVALRYE